MNRPSERFALSQFLAEHHRELALLGVFAALAGLSARLTTQFAQQSLMFVTVALALTLWFEVSRSFPRGPAGFLLYLFQALMWLAMLGLLVYWVATLAQMCSVDQETAAVVIIIVAGSLIYASSRRFVPRPAFLQTMTLKFDPVRIIFVILLAVAVLVLALATAQPAAEAVTGVLPEVREALSMEALCAP
jgi:hypothetical protein